MKYKRTIEATECYFSQGKKKRYSLRFYFSLHYYPNYNLLLTWHVLGMLNWLSSEKSEPYYGQVKTTFNCFILAIEFHFSAY